MAKRRSSRKRRETDRPSSRVPKRLSKTPPPVRAKPADQEDPKGQTDALPAKSAQSFFDVPEGPKEEGDENSKQKAEPKTAKAHAKPAEGTDKAKPKGSDEDPSAAKDDAANNPAKDAKHGPEDLKEKDPRSKPSEHSAPRAEPNASPDEPAKTEGDGQEDPDEGERDSNGGDEAFDDDGLHGDFFRQGEEVDKEHIAAHTKVNEPLKLEDTGHQRLVALRTSPEGVERRRRFRRIVAYALAPAVVIAAIAAYKSLDGGANASADSSGSGAILQRSAPSNLAAIPVAKPTAFLSENSPLEMDAGQDVQAGVEGDGNARAESADAAAHVELAAAPVVSTESAGVPDGVDLRKEALVALDRANWERAAMMAGAAIAKNPEDATLYLYQGTALQEMGKRAEATEVFMRCVASAKRGPINECRMFAR